MTDSLHGGGPTAIERRGLIALAIVLVAAVAAIGSWRGSNPPTPSEAASEVEMAEVENAASVDSVSSNANEKKKSRKRVSAGKKQKAPTANTKRRQSPLDEAVD